MGPVPEDPMANRVSFRDKYDKAASDLLKALRSDPRLTYTNDDLTKLRVTLESFDPEDQNFIASNICLFKPMSSEQVEKYSLDVSEQPEGTRNLCDNYDDLYQSPTGAIGRSLSDIMDYNAEITYLYLKRHYESSYNTKRYPESLAGTSKWDQITDGNTFLDIRWGLLGGYSPTNKIPPWSVRADYEWQDDYRDPQTIRPHMMLVMFTGAAATEDELLFCELGCIVQVIRNRLQQKEFEKTSLFPVLIISLFGPRHGRLVQAKFNISGVLKVRASPIYSFVLKENAPWKLFLRYLACEPRDGPEIEFGDNEGECVPNQAPEYVSPVPGSSKESDAPTQAPSSLFPEPASGKTKSGKNKHAPTKIPKPIPKLPEIEKENTLPEGDNPKSPSADDL